jgi:hypothetical protein
MITSEQFNACAHPPIPFVVKGTYYKGRQIAETVGPYYHAVLIICDNGELLFVLQWENITALVVRELPATWGSLTTIKGWGWKDLFDIACANIPLQVTYDRITIPGQIIKTIAINKVVIG